MVQIEKWLSANDQYRLADLNDCKCDAQIKEVRKGDDVYSAKHSQTTFLIMWLATLMVCISFAVIVLGKKVPFQTSQSKKYCFP